MTDKELIKIAKLIGYAIGFLKGLTWHVDDNKLTEQLVDTRLYLEKELSEIIDQKCLSQNNSITPQKALSKEFENVLYNSRNSLYEDGS